MSEKGGLTQDDFRKLLSTPRAERMGGSQTPRGAGGSAQPPQQKSIKPHRPKPKPKQEEDDEDGGPQYR